MEDSDTFIQEVLDAHNKLRTNPKYFIPTLEEMASSFSGVRLTRPGRVTLVTHEGAKAVNEAIAFLKKQKPISEVSLSKALCKASQDHASDLGGNNMTGHAGSDGSDNEERVKRYCGWGVALGENCQFGDTPDGGHEAVLQLLIDDGIASRGHRKNIFNSDFVFIGVGVAPHGTYRQCCVIDYAGEVTDIGDDDHIAAKGVSAPKKKAAPKATHEESKVVGDGYVKMADLPEEIRSQIEAMNLGDDIKVKKEGSEYKIEYSAKTTKSSGSKKADHAAPAAKHKAPAAAHDGDEPEGYISKSVSTQTKTCGKKSTKTTTTVYKFADGSSKTFTKTETHG